MGGTQGSDAVLPYYLARHLGLGFDADDVTTLISSIDASQRPHDSSLPHLPAELLFLILEHIPVDYILPWRLVCRGVRDYIDGPVLYQYLRRAELIGYLGAHNEYPLKRLNDSQYDEIRFIRTHFERLETQQITEGISNDSNNKWSGTLAIFQVSDPTWKRNFQIIDEHMKASRSARDAWELLLDRLQVLADEEFYGTLRWCLHLDKAILELEYPVEKLRDSFAVDITNGRIMIEWKGLLFSFLKTVWMLRKTMDDKKDSDFTYGHEEDCLRQVRRQRLRCAIDMDDGAQRRVKWEMNLLRPLFGKPGYDQVAIPLRNYGPAEKSAINILTFLRKEAALSRDELVHLQQLAEDRKAMESELEVVNSTFLQWRNTLFDTRSGSSELVPRLTRVPINPLAWSDEERATEEARIKRWRNQKNMLQQFYELLNSSQEAMNIPDNAFDDLGSDI